MAGKQCAVIGRWSRALILQMERHACLFYAPYRGDGIIEFVEKFVSPVTLEFYAVIVVA